MVARVWFRGGHSAAMRVSLPGFDVTVANLSQLAFDSRFANLEVFRRGIVNIVGNNAANVFSYGETIPAPPLGFFLFFNGVSWNSPSIVKAFNGTTTETNARYVALGQSSMTIQITQASSPGATLPVRYVLFRPLAA